VCDSGHAGVEVTPGDGPAHREYSGFRVVTVKMVTLTDASCDLNINRSVAGTGITRQQFAKNSAPRTGIVRVPDGRGGQAAIQTLQVLFEPEHMPAEYRDDFIYTVPERKSAIEHRDTGFNERQKLPVQVDDDFHPITGTII